MSRFKFTALASAFSLLTLGAAQSQATDLEVTHWWTSGGEAAAVKVFADAFTAAADAHQSWASIIQDAD